MDINTPLVSAVITQTAAFTLTPEMSGAIVRAEFASAATITIPTGLPSGFAVTIVQSGVGQVTFAAATGATLRNRSGHTKTAGQYAMCAVIVGLLDNPILAGDTVA